jgi:tetratricopeptide (TPR) repeat protein
MAFLALWLGGGLVGGLLPRLLEGKWRFSGIGLPLGAIAGVAIYLILYPLPRVEDAGEDHRSIILIALLSAIMAHFIEIQSGIAIAATRTYFWLYAALVIVLGSYRLERMPARASMAVQTAPGGRAGRWRGVISRPHSREVESGHTFALSVSLLTGLTLATLAFPFSGVPLHLRREGMSVLVLLFAVWLAGGLVLAVRSSDGAEGEAPLSLYPLLSVGWFFLFALGHLSRVGSDPAGALIVYIIYLFLTVGAVAVALLRKEEFLSAPLWRKRLGWLYPALVVAVLWLISVTNLNPIKADICYKQGIAYADTGQWDPSIALFQRARTLAPDEDFYCTFLAGAYVEKAKTVSSADERSVWLEESRKALERGRELNPLNPDHTSKLGLLYRAWGEMAAGPVEREEKLRRALEYYEQAATLSPHSPSIFTEWGQVHYLLREYDEAIEKHQHALQLNRWYFKTYLPLGDAYAAVGEWDHALEFYKRALQYDREGILQSKRRAVTQAPNDYVAHQSLALLYDQLGQKELALSEARKARDLAPPGERSNVERLIARLEKQK